MAFLPQNSNFANDFTLDIHIKLNHSIPSHNPTNEDLMDAIEVWKIYKLLQRMKNTHLLNNPKFKTHQAQV